MRRLVWVALALLALAALSGCAYYNTFYGARKAWDKAMEEHDRNPLEGATAAEIGQYDQCIRSSTNLLIRYPNSKYVDEAVLLIGKCMLGKGDYEPAVTQFQLLCDSLPQSRLVPDALLGQGQALLRLRRVAESESTLTDLMRRFPDFKASDEVLLTLGDGMRQQKRSRDALEIYTRLIREHPDSKARYRAQTFRGETYFQLEEWDSAGAEFTRVGLDAPRDDDRFAARLKVGQALELARRFDDAIAYYRQQQIDLNALSRDIRQLREPELKLRIADCEAQRGNPDKAIDMYTDIKETNPSDRFGSAAAYQLGYLYETQKEDFEKARGFYDACRGMPRSEFTDLASERNAGLARAAEYKKKMTEGKSHFDSSAETAFLLAELYCFDMKKYDRALGAYQDVERRFGFTRFGPKASYASAWVLNRMKDSTAADSAYARAAARYPDTPFGHAALDSLRARHGAMADSLVLLGRRDTTNAPLPRPPEAIADSIAQAARADSIRKATVSDSLRHIAMTDSLQREDLKRRAAARADSAVRAAQPKLPPGSSMPVIQAAEPDAVDPRDAKPPATPSPVTDKPKPTVPPPGPGAQAPPGFEAPPARGAPADSVPAPSAKPDSMPSGPAGSSPPDTSRARPGKQ
jgi:TolA-binding protein